MLRYGLDFGTTNSAMSVFCDGQVSLLPLDLDAIDSRVIRSALYYFPKQIVFDQTVSPEQKTTNEFNIKQISYSGETKTLFGTSAVNQYLSENKNRKPGIKRRFFLGTTTKMALYTSYGGSVVMGDIDNYIDETDYGTGRLFHALKTALKSKFYKGSTLYGEFISLEQLIATLISEFKKNADHQLGEEVHAVRVGRPVVFRPDKSEDLEIQRRLEKSLRLAGFDDIEFEYEPIGAAKYYLHTHPHSKPQKLLIFDFGGGTLDTTIVSNYPETSVLATDGVYIGGDLFNSVIFESKLDPYFGKFATWGDKNVPFPTGLYDLMHTWFGAANLNTPDNMRFLTSQAQFNHSDPKALERLIHYIKMNLSFEVYEAIEKAKKDLSKNTTSSIQFIDGPINIDISLSRHEFEQLIAPYLVQVQNTIDRTLQSASLLPQEIDKVITTGGSSLIPVVRQLLEQKFGADKIEIFDNFTSVASGLCLP